MFSENLRFLRRKKNMSQPDLANLLGYKSFTTIQKWEDGTSTPPYNVLKQLSMIFNVEVKDLMGESYQARSIPVLGTVRGGAPIFAEDNIKEYELPDESLNDAQNYFCVDVVGDSMINARILPGDRLFVHKQDSLENYEIGIILIGDEATVKRVIYQDDKMILKPENDAYEPIILTRKDQEEKGIRILGKVVYNKIRY